MASQRHQRAFSLGDEFVVVKPFYFHGQKYAAGAKFPWRRVSCSVRQLRKFWEQRKVNAVEAKAPVKAEDAFKDLVLPDGYKISCYPDDWCYVEDPDGGGFKAQGLENAQDALEEHVATKALAAAHLLVESHEADLEAKRRAGVEARARERARDRALLDARILIAEDEDDEDRLESLMDESEAMADVHEEAEADDAIEPEPEQPEVDPEDDAKKAAEEKAKAEVEAEAKAKKEAEDKEAAGGEGTS